MKAWSLALVLLIGGAAVVTADPQGEIKTDSEEQRAVAALKQFERSLKMSVGIDRDGYNIYMWGPQITDTNLAFMMVHIKRLRRLASLTLVRTAITAEGLKQLRELPDTKSLRIENTDSMADGLAHLKHVPGLERLSLASSNATDGSLVHLQGLKNLTSLSISSSLITDAGLKHIGELTNLTRLSLAMPVVTDAGLAKLKNLTKLKSLQLAGCRITDRGLVHLKRMTKLTDLCVSRTQVTDAGIAHLVGLTNLERLHLYGNKITDRAVAQLSQRKKLRWLDLNRTQVTEEGIRQLKRALPDARIQSPVAVVEPSERPPVVVSPPSTRALGPDGAPVVRLAPVREGTRYSTSVVDGTPVTRYSTSVVEGAPVPEGTRRYFVDGQELPPAVSAAFKRKSDRQNFLFRAFQAEQKKATKKLLDELEAAKQAAIKAGDGDVAKAIQQQIDTEKELDSVVSEVLTIEASRKRLIGTVWKGARGEQFTIKADGQIVSSTGKKRRWAFVRPYGIIVWDGEISADILDFGLLMNSYSRRKVGQNATQFVPNARVK